MDPAVQTILILALVGLSIVLFFVGRRTASDTGSDPAEKDRLREEAVRTATQLDLCRTKISELETQAEEDQKKILELSQNLAARDNEVSNWKKRFEEFQTNREKETERLTTEFENLANRILESSAKKVGSIQEQRLGELLKPVGDKFTEFQKSVRELREQGISHQAKLGEQLETLRQAGSDLGEEARNLTEALRGQKTQGMWGEFLLERVLESSGLQKGEEYKVQESHSQEGSRLQPDVIVYLPEGKHLIVDAKVSLTAYLRLTKASIEKEQTDALRDHIASLKSHIDGLSSKGYDAIEGLRSPEIVLLFIPIEPAFVEALRADPSLFDYAFKKRIVLVTPSTLLATLKTVASIWRQEKQNRHALEIARLGGQLYDKFVGFTKDLDEVSQRLDQARKAHDNAYDKLTRGRGNAVRTLQKMKDLGLKTKQEIDPARIEAGEQEDEAG